MKTLVAILLGALLLPASVLAGEPPVTKVEASAAFTKAHQVIKRVLKVKTDLATFPTGAGVASRSQILRHFDSVIKALEPKFKFTPPKVSAAVPYISFKDPATKKLAERLETMGFLDRYGALATSKNEGLEPRQFGEALGFFMARLAELTHTPSSEFSPYLMPGGSIAPEFEKGSPPPKA